MLWSPTVVELRRASVRPTVPRRANGQGTLASAKVASAPKSGPASLTGEEPPLGSSPAGARPARTVGPVLFRCRQRPSEDLPRRRSCLVRPQGRPGRRGRPQGRRAKTGVGLSRARSRPPGRSPGRRVRARSARRSPWAGQKRKVGIHIIECRPFFCERTRGWESRLSPFSFPRGGPILLLGARPVTEQPHPVEGDDQGRPGIAEDGQPEGQPAREDEDQG